MHKRLALIGLAAGLAGGSVAGMTLGVPGLVGAQTSPAPSTTAPAQTKPDQSAWARKALDPLVANGTINQSQEDAVVNALQSARPEGGRGKGMVRVLDLDTAASKIGVSPDALRQALANGQSIADVARSKNVDPQVVIDALVAKAQSDLAAQVSAGKLTQAQADQRLAKLKDAIPQMVNGQMPAGKAGGGPGRHFGQPEGGSSSSSTTTPSTSSSSSGGA